jgi:hypothetical protein
VCRGEAQGVAKGEAQARQAAAAAGSMVRFPAGLRSSLPT